MKEILAYSNSARPLRADEGQVFINITTQEMFIFHDGYWRPFVAEPVTDAKTMEFPKITPSTPEEVLCEECKVEVEEKVEEPAPVEENVEEAPKPKKTSKKKTTKKAEK